LYSDGEAWYGIAKCAAKAGLKQEVRKALNATLAIRHTWSRDVGLTGVLLGALEMQDEDWTHEVKSLVSTISWTHGQAEVLVKMSEVASSAGNSSRLEEYLTAAEHMDDPNAKARVLGAICRAMWAIGNYIGVDKCLQSVERYEHEAAKADAVQEVLPVLVRSNNSEGLRRMAVAARTVWYEPPRCRALSAVAHAMERAGMSADAKALALQAMETAERLVEKHEAWGSIEILSNCETADLLEVALLAAERMNDAIKTAEVIGKLSPKAVQTPDLFDKILCILPSVRNTHAYVDALNKMSGSLMLCRDQDRLSDLWISAFKRGMTQTRKDTFYMLQRSAKPIASLDDGVSLTYLAKVILDTETWWSIA
jgi:hypothetical protein